jgi:AGZA family xanthine/uracil permease-like MFS transporter
MLYLTKLATGGRIAPAEEEQREYWTIKPGGQLPWFIRLAQSPRGVFRNEDETESFRKSDSGSATEVNHTVEEKM